MTKGRVNSQQGDIKEVLGGMHLYISENSTEFGELNEESIEQRLRACGGAHQPTSFDFKNQFDLYL